MGVVSLSLCVKAWRVAGWSGGRRDSKVGCCSDKQVVVENNRVLLDVVGCLK